MSISFASSRRAFLCGGILLLSAGLLSAADESAKTADPPEEIHPWTAGGKKHGSKARQDDGPVEGGLSWLTSKMWSFYHKGRITYFRPGKDQTEKGEEVYWTGEHTLLGKAGARRLWRMDMTEEADEGKPAAPGLMILMDEKDAEGEAPGNLTLLFFLAGAKGDKLDCKFDQEKDPAGRLIVTQQPGGKGAAHSYEFSFAGGVPKLIEPPKEKKSRKKG